MYVTNNQHMSRLDTLLEYYNEDPSDTFVIYSLAQEYNSMGNTDESRKFYHVLKNVDSDYIGLYYHLGKLEESVGNLKTAMEVYQDGIDIAKRLGETHALSELSGALGMVKIIIDN